MDQLINARNYDYTKWEPSTWDLGSSVLREENESLLRQARIAFDGDGSKEFKRMQLGGNNALQHVKTGRVCILCGTYTCSFRPRPFEGDCAVCKPTQLGFELSPPRAKGSRRSRISEPLKRSKKRTRRIYSESPPNERRAVTGRSRSRSLVRFPSPKELFKEDELLEVDSDIAYYKSVEEDTVTDWTDVKTEGEEEAVPTFPSVEDEIIRRLTTQGDREAQKKQLFGKLAEMWPSKIEEPKKANLVDEEFEEEIDEEIEKEID